MVCPSRYAILTPSNKTSSEQDKFKRNVYDPETGLYCLGSRYYDPEVGRFVNADDTDVDLCEATGIRKQKSVRILR